MAFSAAHPTFRSEYFEFSLHFYHSIHELRINYSKDVDASAQQTFSVALLAVPDFQRAGHSLLSVIDALSDSKVSSFDG